MSTQSPRRPLTGDIVQLARAGNAVERLVGLVALTSALEKRGASTAEVGELRSLKAEIVPEAERQVRALLALFESHGDELDALVTQRVAGGHQVACGVQERFTANGITRATRLLDRLAMDHEVDDHDVVCAALDTLVMQEDVKCIAGSDLSCATGEQWFQLAQLEGCV